MKPQMRKCKDPDFVRPRQGFKTCFREIWIQGAHQGTHHHSWYHVEGPLGLVLSCLGCFPVKGSTKISMAHGPHHGPWRAPSTWPLCFFPRLHTTDPTTRHGVHHDPWCVCRGDAHGDFPDLL